ncbi:hypothetical protein ACGF0D_03695 [Kitasatospora sp. NPDC048298]|uniref:hypothetical protein n=1 Tax=Kitasatospora sp. NPDC048298 TaxID=3364049 RepID=UPI0037232B56
MTSPADAPGTGERVLLTSAQRTSTTVPHAEAADALPSAAVLDVGPIADPYDPADHWAVVEANLPWLAHCYAADPERVLDVVLRAARPAAELDAADRRFVRPSATGRRAADREPAG